MKLLVFALGMTLALFVANTAVGIFTGAVDRVSAQMVMQP